jgi:hypothetical protein
MKILVDNQANKTRGPIFKGSNKEIYQWVKNNLQEFVWWLDDIDSCRAYFEGGYKIIIIGDNDYCELRIGSAKVVDCTQD